MATSSAAGAKRFVAYCRVSTGRQAQGYGVEAQRADVRRYVDDVGCVLVGEYFEAVSGRRGDRPKLAEALKTCRLKRATLVVARLDRLSRNVAFVTALMESSQQFVIVDFPEANRFTVHVLAAIAEYESNLISERVKEALAAAPARGTKLGRRKGEFPGKRSADNSASVRARAAKSAARARDLAPIVWDLVAKGFSRKSIAGEFGPPRRQIGPGTSVGTVFRRPHSAKDAGRIRGIPRDRQSRGAGSAARRKSFRFAALRAGSDQSVSYPLASK